MTVSKETWDATASELQRIVDDIDAGAVDGTPEQRAFLVGAIGGLLDHDDEPQPLPELPQDAMQALRHAINDLRARVNAGEAPATVEERECLNRYASFLDESDVSGGYPVDHPGDDSVKVLVAPYTKASHSIEPQNEGLAEHDGRL